MDPVCSLCGKPENPDDPRLRFEWTLPPNVDDYLAKRNPGGIPYHKDCHEYVINYILLHSKAPKPMEPKPIEPPRPQTELLQEGKESSARIDEVFDEINEDTWGDQGEGEINMGDSIGPIAFIVILIIIACMGLWVICYNPTTYEVSGIVKSIEYVPNGLGPTKISIIFVDGNSLLLMTEGGKTVQVGKYQTIIYYYSHGWRLKEVCGVRDSIR